MKNHGNNEARKKWLITRCIKCMRNKRKRKKTKIHVHNVPLKPQSVREKIVYIVPPTNVSFLECPEDMTRFANAIIEKAKNLKFKEKNTNKVHIDFSKIESADTSGLLLIMGTALHVKERINDKIEFGGIKPCNYELEYIFNSLRFYHTMENIGKLVKSFEYVHRETKGNARIIAEARNIGYEHTFGTKDIEHEAVYEILSELNGNTIEHAYPNTNKEPTENWWLVVERLENKVTRYHWFDAGIGIIESLKPCKEYSTLKKLGVKNNIVDFMYDILMGKLEPTKSSASGKINRGLGLRGIYRYLNNKCISRLVIISNRICFDFPNKKGIEMRENFSGTYVSFEIRPENALGEP